MFRIFLKENLLVCGLTSTSTVCLSSVILLVSARMSSPSGRFLWWLLLTLYPVHPYLSPWAQWHCLPNVLFLCVWPRFGCAFLEDRDDVLLAWMAFYVVLHSQCLAQRRQNICFLIAPPFFYLFVMVFKKCHWYVVVASSWWVIWYLLHCCCSVTQLCPTLCDPMDCSTSGFPVLHHLPEFT